MYLIRANKWISFKFSVLIGTSYESTNMLWYCGVTLAEFCTGREIMVCFTSARLPNLYLRTTSYLKLAKQIRNETVLTSTSFWHCACNMGRLCGFAWEA